MTARKNSIAAFIDLETVSYFYTDSVVDAPALEMFGHPVAVYPDSELASLAAARGWPVIGDSDAEVKKYEREWRA